MKDYFGYQDKVCVVTGAASGMGKATAEMLVDLGACVYGLDMNEVKIPGLALAIRANLSDKASIDAAFAQIPGPIDRFFGCAGLSGARTDWWLTFTVNFIANKYMIEAYIDKRMPNGGAIALITSIGGLHWENHAGEYKKILQAGTWEEMIDVMHRLAPQTAYGPFAYILSKRALNAYVAKRARYWSGKGIRINAILPGGAATGLQKDFEAMSGGADKMVENCGLAGRLGQPREMAGPLVFLNSDMASYLTATLLPVDYGDTTLKIIKEKKSLTNIPVNLKLLHSQFVIKLIMSQLQKGQQG